MRRLGWGEAARGEAQWARRRVDGMVVGRKGPKADEASSLGGQGSYHDKRVLSRSRSSVFPGWFCCVDVGKVRVVYIELALGGLCLTALKWSCLDVTFYSLSKLQQNTIEMCSRSSLIVCRS